jgi:hypothetical protein
MASSPHAPGTALPVSEHKPAPSAPQGLLPSPPPTRDPSIASGSHEPERAGDGPSSGTAPPDGEADITDSGLHADAGTHAGAAHARAPLPDRTSLRVSTPWLDMGSDDGASPQPADGEGSPDALEFRHSLALGDSDGMAESPAEEAVLDIRAPGAPAQAGPSRLPAPTHPLRAPVPAPGAPRRGSLQPWELLEPPADNNTGRGRGGTVSSAGTHGPFATLRSQRSRPLVPKSSYYFGPPPPGSAFGSDPAGTLGVHHPREVLRIERDYTGGETIQFVNVYPLELEGRVRTSPIALATDSLNASDR